MLGRKNTNNQTKENWNCGIIADALDVRYFSRRLCSLLLLWQMLVPTDIIHHIYGRLIGAMLIQAQPGLFKQVRLRHQGQAADKWESLSFCWLYVTQAAFSVCASAFHIKFKMFAYFLVFLWMFLSVILLMSTKETSMFLISVQHGTK